MPGDENVRPKKRSRQQKRKKAPKRSAQLRCVHAFLTYPRCPLDVDNLIKHMTELARIEKYVVCQEEHKEQEQEERDPMDVDGPCPTHLHGYFKFPKKTRLLFEKLTLVGPDGTEYRGNYQSCRNANDVALYCTKEGNYKSTFSAEELARMAEQAKPKQTFGDVMKLAKEGDLKAAFETLTRVAPRDVIMKGAVAMKANLSSLDQSKPEREESGFKFTEPEHYKTWDREKQSLLLIGVTGTGKSNFARKYALKNPCVVSGTTLDGLKRYNPDKNDGIVFDEMDFGARSPELQLQLTGVEDTVQVNVKMTHVEIPAGTPRIFVLNYFPFSQPVKPELARRIHCVAVDKDLRVRTAAQIKAQEKKPDELRKVVGQFSRKKEEPEAEPFFYCGDK